MRKLTPILLILSVLISQLSAVNLRKSQNHNKIIEELKEVASQSEYAQRLIPAITLQLKSTGGVEDAVRMIRVAISDTQNQKAELNSEYQTEMARLNALIKELEDTLENLNTNLNDVVESIARLNKDITDLGIIIVNTRAYLDSLTAREDLIRQARTKDIESFQFRQTRDTKALEALNQIIPALEGMSFIEKSRPDIQEALKNVPNQVQALIELSSQFDKGKAAILIQKLKLIRESIAQGKLNDETRETESKQTYDALISLIDQERTRKSKELNDAEVTLTNKQIELANTQVRKRDLILEINETNDQKNKTVELRDVTDQDYKQRIVFAENAVKALKTALKIMQDNQPALKESEDKAYEDALTDDA